MERLRIVLRRIARSPAVEARIRERAAKLQQLHPRIMSCRVAVDRLALHHRRTGPFRVKVEIHAPYAPEVVATLKRHADVFVAVGDAFDAAHRRLQGAAREPRPPRPQ